MAEKKRPAATSAFSDLQRINRTEAEVYRGNEKTPTLTLKSPAYGIFNSRGTERVTKVSTVRGLGTAKPNRFELYYSNSSRTIIAVPQLVTEATDDEDLFEVLWSDVQGRATVNLIELLQPRNMTVPQGQVMELPVRVEEIEALGTCLVVDMSEPVYRQVREEAATEVAAGTPIGGSSI